MAALMFPNREWRKRKELELVRKGYIHHSRCTTLSCYTPSYNVQYMESCQKHRRHRWWLLDSPKVTYPTRTSDRWKLALINSLSYPEQTLNGHVVDCYCYCLVNMDDSTGCLWSGYGTMGTDYSSGCSQAQFSPVPLALECWSWGADAWVSGRIIEPSDYRYRTAPLQCWKSQLCILNTDRDCMQAGSWEEAQSCPCMGQPMDNSEESFIHAFIHCSTVSSPAGLATADDHNIHHCRTYTIQKHISSYSLP